MNLQTGTSRADRLQFTTCIPDRFHLRAQFLDARLDRTDIGPAEFIDELDCASIPRSPLPCPEKSCLGHTREWREPAEHRRDVLVRCSSRVREVIRDFDFDCLHRVPPMHNDNLGRDRRRSSDPALTSQAGGACRLRIQSQGAHREDPGTACLVGKATDIE